MYDIPLLLVIIEKCISNYEFIERGSRFFGLLPKTLFYWYGFFWSWCASFGDAFNLKGNCSNDLIEKVRDCHLRLRIVGSITLDCREGQPDPMSEAFLQMAGVFSRLEFVMIQTRVRSGMANARAKGRQIGRPQLTTDQIPPVFYRRYPAYKNGSLNLSEFARVCDLSRTTVYKYISLLDLDA